MAGETLAFDVFAKDRASKVFSKVGDSAEKTHRKFAKFGAGVGVVMTNSGARLRQFAGFAATGLGAAGVAAAGLGVVAAKMGIKTAAALEQAEIGFTTLLKSGTKARKFLDDLKTFAAKTPFELPGLIESSRLLIGVGLTTKQTKGILQDFGDAASAVGVGQEAFQRIMLATSQAVSAGRFTIEDLNQITENGIPIWKVLSEAMHKPVPELRDLATKGKLLTNDVLPLLQAQMKKDYGGSMARQSETLNGLWSTFMDTLNLGLAEVIKPFEGELKSGLKGATKAAGDALSALPGVIQKVMSAFEGVDLSGFAKKLKEDAVSWSGAIISGVKTGMATGDWSGLGKTLGDKMAALVVGAGGLVVKLTEALANVDWFNVGKRIGKTAAPFALGFVTTFWDGVFDAFRKHPIEATLAVVAFIPIGKAMGLLGKLLQKVPFLNIFAPLFIASGKAADLMAKPFAAVGRFITKNFIEGFAKHFPGAATALKSGLDNIVTSIYVKADDAGKAALRFVSAIPRGIGSGLGAVTAAAGRIIKFLLSPFANSGVWLIGKGRAVVVGLARGIMSVVGGLIGSATRVMIGAVIRPFGPAGAWLVGAGRAVVSGFTRGLRAVMGSVGSTLSGLRARAINAGAGAGGWLVGAGRALISGFVSGIRSMAGMVASEARSVVSRAVDAAKRALGIGSPSKVFAEIGRNVGKGYVGGLADTQRSVTRAVTDLIAPSSIGAVSGVSVPTVSGRRRRRDIGHPEPVGQAGGTFKAEFNNCSFGSGQGDVEAEVDRAFGKLLREIRTGGRR